MKIETSSLVDFMELLHLEIDTHRKLVALLEEEKRILSMAEVGLLREINKRIETVLVELRVLEEARKGMVEGFADDLQVDASELTLSRLSEILPQDIASGLDYCQKTLSSLIHRMQELLKINSDLIDYSFKINNNLLSFLGSCVGGDQTYDSSGAYDEGPRRSSFLAQRA